MASWGSMKQRGIGDRFSVSNRLDRTTRRYARDRMETRAGARSGRRCRELRRSLRGSRLEARDQVVEAQLLETLADRLQLARGELDQPLALLAELERLAEAGLVRVEPADDVLEPLDGGLVGGGLSGRGRCGCGFGAHSSLPGSS